MSAAGFRTGTLGAAAIEYAAVTEQVAMEVGPAGRFRDSRGGSHARHGGVSRRPEHKVSVAGRVAILREQRLDEQGRVRRLKSRPGILSVGDELGSGEYAADLAVEQVERLSLLVKGLGGSMSAVAAARRGAMLRTPDM